MNEFSAAVFALAGSTFASYFRVTFFIPSPKGRITTGIPAVFWRCQSADPLIRNSLLNFRRMLYTFLVVIRRDSFPSNIPARCGLLNVSPLQNLSETRGLRDDGRWTEELSTIDLPYTYHWQLSSFNSGNLVRRFAKIVWQGNCKNIAQNIPQCEWNNYSLKASDVFFAEICS